VEIGLCLGVKTKTYMTNYEIVRMEALNCFEEFSLVNWHLNVIIVPRFVIGVFLGEIFATW